MEPIPETRRAVDDFGPFTHGGDDLVVELVRKAAEVRALVPECVGVSLAALERGTNLTFTVVATDGDTAELDAVQYADGGPCVDGVAAERPVEFHGPAATDENDWAMFARAIATRGIQSTLTLPILADGTVVGSVNLYASTADAFTGQHESIAAVFGAWAPGAVTNADLDFTTRQTAARAPEVLAEQLDIDIATGILAARLRLDPATARDRLRLAAQRAGITEAALAGLIRRVQRDVDDR